MGKIVRKSSDDIRSEWTPEKIINLTKKDIPSFSTGITDEDMATGQVKRIGRGFAVFKENINRNGRPVISNKKVVVSIRPAGF